MKAHQTFARTLDELLGTNQAVRITVAGYMPLSIERIASPPHGAELIAISHTTVLNGDLMRDPEVVFEIVAFPEPGGRYAEPISFRNDFLAAYQEVYTYDAGGTRTGAQPRLRTELLSFVSLWFRNLREQGFLAPDTDREVLG